MKEIKTISLREQVYVHGKYPAVTFTVGEPVFKEFTLKEWINGSVVTDIDNWLDDTFRVTTEHNFVLIPNENIAGVEYE